MTHCLGKRNKGLRLCSGSALSLWLDINSRWSLPHWAPTSVMRRAQLLVHSRSRCRPNFGYACPLSRLLALFFRIRCIGIGGASACDGEMGW